MRKRLPNDFSEIEICARVALARRDFRMHERSQRDRVPLIRVDWHDRTFLVGSSLLYVLHVWSGPVLAHLDMVATTMETFSPYTTLSADAILCEAAVVLDLPLINRWRGRQLYLAPTLDACNSTYASPK